MLTRLEVDGFKSLVGTDVQFGPFTCIAGPNGVGKSNLFDAITFLSDLADKSLLEAALSVRAEGGRAGDVRGLFNRAAGARRDRMRFAAEMIVPPTGHDDLGQEARATTTFLRYELELAWQDPEIVIIREALDHVKKSEARDRLGFPHDKRFRESLGIDRRTGSFLSTIGSGDDRFIKIHQDSGPGKGSGGRPRQVIASRLPRTVLSTTTAAESPTALLARREVQSWRLLQLEPSALRAPDSYTAPPRLDGHGSHMPATLARLMRLHPERMGAARLGSRLAPPDLRQPDAAAVQARVANRLAELIDGVREVSVDTDDRRELLTLYVTDESRTRHEARALSDGTLRFLALAILENDPEMQGLMCLEEPENGIHPARIPAMLRLLQDLAVDPSLAIDTANPLRQVMINTHSPQVVAQLRDADLMCARIEPMVIDRERTTGTVFSALPGTWRSRAGRTVTPAELMVYLDPLAPVREDSSLAGDRVMDRQELLPFMREESYSE